MAERSIDAYEATLRDGSVDTKQKGVVLTEIRDSVESLCQPSVYTTFLQKLVPVFLGVLAGPPVFTSNSPEQICRQRVLEIVHRMPLNTGDGSVMEPFAEKIVDTCLELVKRENEDNAVLCLKIVMDFCRYTKIPNVADKAQPFLDLILEIFDGMEQTVKEMFEVATSGAGNRVGSGSPHQSDLPGSPAIPSSQPLNDPSVDQNAARPLIKGMQSFKVVSECPIIVVSIFQAHRQLVAKNVKDFKPRIKRTLLLQAEPQKRAHDEAESRDDIFTGIAPEIVERRKSALFGDLITAQVKTMSFLAYLFRAYQQSLQGDFIDILPELTVRLLQDVPRTHTATRKELLVAIRHIINFNFRGIFLRVILPLLDTRTLIGDSITADVTLRPLAYTMLADLIHHVREHLTLEQISRVVTVYVGHLTGEDGVDVPGTSYQTMSAKLLLNMAECMSKLGETKEARYLMMLVLNGIADKFATMNLAYPNAVKVSVRQHDAGSVIDIVPEGYLVNPAAPPDWDQTDIFSAMPTKSVSSRDRATTPVAENKFLFKNILHGLKTFFYQLRNSNPPQLKSEIDEANAPINWNELSCGFEAEEVEVLIKLFREGAKCFQYYAPLPYEQNPDAKESPDAATSSTSNSTASSKEEKDLLETFATIFHHLDPATFHEIFSSGSPSGIAFLYEHSFKHPALLHIPQFLLASEATSPAFCGMLLKFLMSKLDEIGEKDPGRTAVLLRLFKLSFMAVTLFSQHNESVLLPHVRELITRAIELSVNAAEPTNFFLLLRSLFRSIGGGRFEHLYKEILPLLEMLLEVLNTQLAAAPDGGTRDLFVELSLTVPARLSHLLPHLSYLMRPLTVALRSAERSSESRSEKDSIRASSSGFNAGVGTAELTAQGLRTLELCVDNLTADYLDPIMQPWMEEIMRSLWRMLKPTPLTPGAPGPSGVTPLVGVGHQGAHNAVRILGKLGGRNRKFLCNPPDLGWREYADDEASFNIKLIGAVANGGERALPARLGVDTALDTLWDVSRTPAQKSSDEHHKRQAVNFIMSHVKLLISHDQLPDDFAALVRLHAIDLTEKEFDIGTDLFSVSEHAKSGAKRDAQQQTLLRLLKALFFATSIEYLQDDVESFLQGVYRHFMLVDLGVALGKEKHKRQPFDVKSGEGPVYIDTNILADAICNSLASEIKQVRASAENAMTACHHVAKTVFGTEDMTDHLPFFGKLAETCVRSCYEEEWFIKSSGAIGIALLIDSKRMALTNSWVADRVHEMARALLYVVKDMPQDLPANTRLRAKDTLVDLVDRFGENFANPKEELENKTSKLHLLASLLVAEVSHMNRHVRETSQTALRRLAQVVGLPTHELVDPVKEPLIQPIFNKPLRALPFAAQIGYVDAINFLLDMEHGVLTFDEQLNRLLYETLALVDADDEMLAPPAKVPEYRTAESIVRLRVAGLKLLTSTIRFPGFSASIPQQGHPTPPIPSPAGQHRARVISIFFKCLYSKNKEVAAAANAGLKIILAAERKLPKDLLQNGLRPILMNVQDARKLSVEGLEGLRTLLQLLTNYFKVEIGTRLLDHMKVIAESSLLHKVSFTLIESQPKMKVVTAIFSVFHLLPTSAAMFLNTLIERLLDLEAHLRRTRSSPFREPLVKYLNNYPNETWDFFSTTLKDEIRGRFFAQVLGEQYCGALRQKVVDETDAFIAAFTTNGSDEVEAAQATVNAIRIVDAVCQFPDVGRNFIGNSRLRVALLEAAKGLQAKASHPPILRLAIMQSQQRVWRIMTNYLEHHSEDLDTLFDLFESCAKGELPPSPTLPAYLYKNVITNSDVEYQRTIVMRSIDVFASEHSSQKMKWFVLHYSVNPILANDVMRNWDQVVQPNNKGTALLEKSMADAVHNRLWKPQSVATISDDNSHGVDHSRMELLQTSAFLIKYHHNAVQDARKDLIKFGWNYIRLEDHINKYAAYCLIAYFIHHYETPSKIATQVYAALLRAHQAEGRNLVMQSLEILEPVLKKRLQGPDGRQSVWARLPRRILTEEISNLQQLSSIYQFLVKHPDLFYAAREPFATTIIQTISKVAQLSSPSAENRKLALNLCSMIFRWEERTVRENGSLSGHATPVLDREDAQQDKRGAVASPSARLMLVKYLIQFIATLPERFSNLPDRKRDAKDPNSQLYQRPSMDTVARSLELLSKLLQPPFWDDLDIDNMIPKVTEQILCSDVKPDERLEQWTMRVVNTIQILKVMLGAKSPEWIIARLPQLQKLLTKPLRSESFEIQDALHNQDLASGVEPKLPPILQRILEAIPLKSAEDELPDADSPTEEFTFFLSNIAGDTINQGNHMAGINILWIVARRKAEDIDTHIPALLKTLQTKLAKDHLAQQLPAAAALAQGIQQPPPFEIEMTTKLIVKVIDMLSARIGALGEQRRPYLSVLASLVERSHNNLVCEKILDQVEAWVFSPTEPVPTLKEKTAVLQKMLLFEHRQDPTLYTKFMDLVIRIYEDPKILRSELAVRMEHAFLVGLRSSDIEMRQRFVAIFDRSLSRSTSNRIFKLICEQQWDVLSDSFWLSQVIQLMFGCIDHSTTMRLHAEDFTCMPLSKVYCSAHGNGRIGDAMLDDDFETLVAQERQFMGDVGSVRAKDILAPLADLQHTDSQLSHDIWVAYFPMCWSTLSRDDREEIESGLVSLLTKDFHQRQVDRRPNCASTLLEGIARARPVCKFPPHVMKYLGKSYDAWYITATFTEDLAMKPVVDNATVRESNLDALVDIYATLEESDLFYGTWRRRAQFVETNAALSYEQNGIWEKAQNMYEQAQVQARTGSLPFSNGEYMLWEDQWVLCAQKLQQWEVLGEFAKHENINDLYLEAMWRNYDAWNSNDTREQLESIIKAVSDAPTPRRMFFQAFMSLLKLHNKAEPLPEFSRICDENIQLSIKNWHKLPRRITNAHIGLLQNFQHLVELHDASVICTSLAQTNAGNLDVKSQDLKVLLSTWRDRLPNQWDDIFAWQDLVTWRQHIFQLINGTYLSLLNNGAGNATGNSFAYRGYHETAWIINRFAHVARKHQMPEVCITQLSKIYTLPNIEIQEAFLKLREQAKCHYQNRSELTSGLDVINNTNLNYFGPQQKAEFYTLKGMFLSKLSQKDEAHDAFGTALFFDIKLPKAWAEWGRYSDFLLKEDPGNMELASNSLSCYLEAAGQYKSSKSRKLLSRILWLLSLDDSEGSLAKTYEKFQGDQPWWYWVTFIPQLLNNLSRTEGEANIAHQILINLAKTYPQALHFQLRTSREDMLLARKFQIQKEQREKSQRERKQQGQQSADGAKTESPTGTRPESAGGASRPGTSAGDQIQLNGTLLETPKKEGEDQKLGETRPKKPLDHTDALTTTLRTAFPLLYASMEAMVEQMQKHFKCQPDEDAFRLVIALLNDALSYVGRSPQSYNQEAKLPAQTEANITRFAESVLPAHIRKAFEVDFVTNKPTMLEYINKCRKWRDRLAEKLDRRPQTFHLAEATHLNGFRFVWFDEVEVPGQYLQHKDKNQDFVRIERFMPSVDLVRGVAACHRRLKIRGHDGSIHPFAIQHPSPRHARREERMLQLFRILNSTLSKKKESRRRNLQFHLPAIVPLSQSLRFVQDDASYVTPQSVYEDSCRRNETDKDEPTTLFMEKLRYITPQKQDQCFSVKLEALNHVQEHIVPRDLLRQYFAATHPSYDSFWLFRRQFSYQLAALSYITFTMHMTARYPGKMHIARRNGNIYGSELLPYMPAAKPSFQNPDPVPMRLTPNLQVLMGPIHTEGIFTCGLMAIARCLTSDSSYSSTSTNASAAAGTPANSATPANSNNNSANPQGLLESTNCELEHHLSIFIRDEMSFWFSSSRSQSIKEHELREHVQRNADAIVNKAIYLAKDPQASNIPANQSVLDLVSKATNPEALCLTDLLWMPWL